MAADEPQGRARSMTDAVPEAWNAALRSAESFSALDDGQLSRLARALEEREILAGQCLVTQGEPADSLFVVVPGELQVHVNGPEATPLRSLGSGSIAGDGRLILRRRRT